MKDLSFDNKYSISENGEIYSKNRGIYLKYSVDNSGYYRVTLWDSSESKPKRYLVHRLLAETFIPNPHNLPYVNHKDGDKLNLSISNL